MKNVDEFLKILEPVDIMFILSKERAQSAKYFFENGLANYNGIMLEPEELMKLYIIDHPLLTVVGGNVSRRHIEEYKGKSYRWETLINLHT